MTGCIPAFYQAVSAPLRQRSVSLRHEQGRSYLASLLNYWLRRSELSQDQFGKIVDWGLGEPGWLSSSQITHIRNRKLVRGVSSRNLEGMAGANRAIWLWHTVGQQGAWQELGPHTSWKVLQEWLDGAIWLPCADDETKPLTFGHFCEINAGMLQVPYLQDVSLSPTESAVLSKQLYSLLNELAGGGTPAEGIARVIAAYPVTDANRQRRLRDLMVGEPWTREELEREMYALSVAVSTLRGLEDGSYGPAALHAELSADRRRT